jgi:hypothetical protein
MPAMEDRAWRNCRFRSWLSHLGLAQLLIISYETAERRRAERVGRARAERRLQWWLHLLTQPYIDEYVRSLK